MANRDEILRFVAQVEGKKDVEGMGKAFDAVGKAADNADPAAKKLMDDLERLSKEKGAVESFVKLKAQLSETRTKLGEATAGLEALRKEFGNADGSSKQVTKAFVAAEKAVADLTKAERAQSVEMQKVSGTLVKAGVDATKLAEADRRLADEGQKLAQRMREFAATATAAGKGAKDAAAGVEELAKKSKEAKDDGEGLLGSLGKIGVLAAALGAALKGVQIGTDAFAGAVAIEQSLARVQALATGTAEQFARLGTVVQEAAREAQVAPEVAAQAMAELAGQGQSVDQAFQSLIPTLRLAKIAQIEVGAAAGAVDDVLDLFGLSADQAAKAVDVLVLAAKGSDEGLQGLLGGLSKIAPTARDAGLSFEQTAGMLGVFVQNGFSAEKAAKGLLKIFDDLRDPTSKLREDLSDLGDHTGDFSTAINTLSDAGGKGKKALDNMDASARNLVLFLLQQGKGAIGEFTESLSKAEGTASKVAKAIDDNLGGAFKNAVSAFDNLATAFLAPILAPLKTEIESVGKAFDAFAKTEAFKKLQDALLQFVQTGLAALRSFMESIDFATLGTKLADFGTNASAFFTKFRTDIEDFARVTANVFNGIGVVVDGAATLIHGAAAVIAGALGAILKAGAYVSELDIGDKLKAQLTGAATAAQQLDQVANTLLDSARTNWDQTGQSVANLKENVDQLLAGLDSTKASADGAGASIASVGAAAEGLPEKVAGATTGVQELGESIGGLPAAVDPAAASVGNLAAATGTLADGPLQKARDRLREAKTALVELQTSAEATPEALAAANAEFQAATVNLEKQKAASEGVKKATDELAAAYKTLGLVSQADLVEKARKATEAFESLQRAQSRGAATAEDVRRAFVAMAEAQLRAAADSDAATRSRVENEIRVKAATLGVVDALEKLGLAGKTAGDEVAAGASKAAAALDETAAAADKAATSAEGLGQSSTNAAAGLQNVATAGAQATEIALDLSQAFAQAAGTAQGLDRITFNLATEQQKQAQAQLESLKQQNLAFDEQAQRLQQLRQQYSYLGDATLQQIAREQQLLEQNQQRRREQDQQRQQQQSSNGSGSSSAGGAVGGRLQLEIIGKAVDVNALVKDGQAMDVLTREMARRLENLAGMGGFNLNRR